MVPDRGALEGSQVVPDRGALEGSQVVPDRGALEGWQRGLGTNLLNLEQ